MKKIVLGISILMISLLVTIVILSKNKHITTEEECFSIPRILTYHYDKDKKMEFEIFINSKEHFIMFSDKNQYYLVENQNQYQLNHVEVSSEKDDSVEEFYKYTLQCDLLGIQSEDMILQNCELFIKNDEFSLTVPIGYVGIYRNPYPPLEFTDLYGNYSYINDELHLIGITIQLNEHYHTLQKVKFGSANGVLTSVEKDQLYDSEVYEGTLKHKVLDDKETFSSYDLLAKYNYYFIPLSYPSLQLITQGCILFYIDDSIYYLDDFCYLANEIHLNQYPNSKQKGEFQYA